METRVIVLAILLLVVGRAQPPAPATGAGGAAQPPSRSGPTTLQSVMRVEPASLASRPLTTTGISVAHAVRLFNAELDMDDGQEVTRPYLAEALPQLNTDTWQVLPDGRMETIHRLRPNLVWHDGAPLSTEDFVFAWKVYGAPQLGLARLPPLTQMQEAVAPDARTLVIRWRGLFPQAASLGKDFQALPRHLLEAPFLQGDAAAFTAQAFWSTQYVGLGPYKLDRWEPGAAIHAIAFDAHVLGRPKIDRIVVRFIADENTVLTNLLAGEIQFATDREALSLGLFNGEGALTETPITPFFPAYQDVDRALSKYPFDARRTEQLVGELGYARGPDGTFTAAGERLALSFLQEAGNQTEREMSILIDTWRQVGIESRPTVMSSTQLRDYEIRATFPSVYSTAMGGAVKGGTKNLINYTTSSMGTPANRWQGSNYSGWSNPDYDRLYQSFGSTLDAAERNRQAVQMARLLSEEVPFIMLFFNYNVSAHASALRGPDRKAFDTLVNWNIHEWELR